MGGLKFFFKNIGWMLMLPISATLMGWFMVNFDTIQPTMDDKMTNPGWSIAWMFALCIVVVIDFFAVAGGIVSWVSSDMRCDPIRLIIDSFKAQKRSVRAKLNSRDDYVSSCRKMME